MLRLTSGPGLMYKETKRGIRVLHFDLSQKAAPIIHSIKPICSNVGEII